MELFGRKKDEGKKKVVLKTKGAKQASNASKLKKTDTKITSAETSFWSNQKISSNVEDILKRPRITEKTAILSGNHAYTFLVDRKYGKKEIMQAFAHVYDKVPLKIHVVNIRGKKKRTKFGEGKTKSKKKAIIYLSSKDKIDFV